MTKVVCLADIVDDIKYQCIHKNLNVSFDKNNKIRVRVFEYRRDHIEWDFLLNKK